MGKLRVGVIFGGKSGEHEVSLLSAQSVMDAMDRDKYEVVQIGIDREGQWISGGNPMALLKARARLRLGEDWGRGEDPGECTVWGKLPPVDLLRSLDVAFPVLHGPYGEDGTVQGLFEIAGVPYVGSGVTASAVGMDKAVSKALFREKGLPVLPYLVVRRKELERDVDDLVRRIESELTYPMFVKPANLGSSVGISKARNREGLVNGLKLAAGYDRKILVEQGISAREIECGVLGNDEPEVSVPGEVVPGKEWYDYEAKYQDDSTELLVPAPLREDLAARVRNIALEAYLALGCRGLSRVDFLLDKETGGVYLNEINTMPGFTPVSMYPLVWRVSGLSYRELVDRLIELALEG